MYKPITLLVFCALLLMTGCRKQNDGILYFQTLPFWDGSFYDENITLYWYDEKNEVCSIEIFEWSPSGWNLINNAVSSDQQLTTVLPKGTYRASLTSPSSSDARLFEFKVDPSVDLTNQSVDIKIAHYIRPASGGNFTFHWSANTYVEECVFILKKGSDFNNSTDILWLDTIQINDNSLYEEQRTGKKNPMSAYVQGVLEGDTAYSWGVKIINNYTESDFTFTSFQTDVTNPMAVTHIYPIGTVPAGNINFQWGILPDVGIVQSDISRTLLYSTSPIFQGFVSGTGVGTWDNYTLNIPPGTYYWRVQSIDEAGNQTYSVATSFTAI